MSNAQFTLTKRTSPLGERWYLTVSLGSTTHMICTTFDPSRYQAWTQLLTANAAKKEAKS